MNKIIRKERITLKKRLVPVFILISIIALIYGTSRGHGNLYIAFVLFQFNIVFLSESYNHFRILVLPLIILHITIVLFLLVLGVFSSYTDFLSVIVYMLYPVSSFLEKRNRSKLG